MEQEFGDTFKELEQSVMEDMRRTYSEKVIDHFLNPRNLGKIEAPDGFGRVAGPCGDTMEIYLRIKNDRIINVSFWTDGCGTATDIVNGSSIIEAQKITQDDVLDALGGLPEDSLHCALLAANTLKEAIRDYLALKNEPWKRAYRPHY